MTCECMEIVRAKLAEAYGPGSDVQLELKTVLIFGEDRDEADLMQALPPLYYTYRAGKKRKRSYVTFNFCPFCGKSPPAK